MTVKYIGIDVDDKAYNVAVCDKNGKELDYFKCQPTVARLEKKLREKEYFKDKIKICYEATYIGYSIYRQLASRGFEG